MINAHTMNQDLDIHTSLFYPALEPKVRNQLNILTRISFQYRNLQEATKLLRSQQTQDSVKNSKSEFCAIKPIKNIVEDSAKEKYSRTSLMRTPRR